MKRFFFLLIMLFAGLGTALGESCFEMPVVVEHHGVYSEKLGDILKFDVYIPPCLDPRIIGGYPAVFLLHGQDMDVSVWEQAGLDTAIRETLQQTSIPPFYTIVPQEDRYLLSLSISDFDDALLQDLIPWVDGHYNTCKNRDCRAVAGISRGALWAEKIAFEHPEVFASVGMLSMPGQPFDDQTLYYLVQRQAPEESLRVRIDVGSGDDYRHEAVKASNQLSYLGYLYEYNITPGGHDTDFWHRMLKEYFVWFSDSWKVLSQPQP